MRRKKKTVMISIKLTEEDLRAIRAQAEKHTEGNVSALLRRAALSHKG